MSGEQDNAGLPEGPDAEYRTAPPDPESIDYRGSVLPVIPEPPPEEVPPESDRFQFTMAEWFLLVTFAAVFLSMLGYVPRATFAALAGLGLLAFAAVISYYKPSRAIFRLAWWVLLAIYALTAIAALLAGS